MPLSVNKITSNVEVVGGEKPVTDGEIGRIVRMVRESVKEDMDHHMRVLGESTIRDQASEVEPY
jgi:hypothetical protein